MQSTFDLILINSAILGPMKYHENPTSIKSWESTSSAARKSRKVWGYAFLKSLEFTFTWRYSSIFLINRWHFFGYLFQCVRKQPYSRPKNEAILSFLVSHMDQVTPHPMWPDGIFWTKFGWHLYLRQGPFITYVDKQKERWRSKILKIMNVVYEWSLISIMLPHFPEIVSLTVMKLCNV